MTPTDRRPTREECIAAAGEAIASGLRTLYGLDGTTVEEAARLAVTPTGPPYEELVQRIRARRAAAVKESAA